MMKVVHEPFSNKSIKYLSPFFPCNRSSNCARNAEGIESISYSPEGSYLFYWHDIRIDSYLNRKRGSSFFY